MLGACYTVSQEPQGAFVTQFWIFRTSRTPSEQTGTVSRTGSSCTYPRAGAEWTTRWRRLSAKKKTRTILFINVAVGSSSTRTMVPNHTNALRVCFETVLWVIYVQNLREMPVNGMSESRAFPWTGQMVPFDVFLQ